MAHHRPVRILCAVVVAAWLAPGASAELAAWNQPEVTAIAKDLTTATEALREAFARQPKPDPGSRESESYHELRYRVQRIHTEARMLRDSLEAGEGRDQTAWVYEILTSHARSARYEVSRVFVAKDVGERAAAVRAALNRLGPYYEPDFQTLTPDPNVEPGPAR